MGKLPPQPPEGFKYTWNPLGLNSFFAIPYNLPPLSMSFFDACFKTNLVKSNLEEINRYKNKKPKGK
jgi:hypothetical protein